MRLSSFLAFDDRVAWDQQKDPGGVGSHETRESLPSVSSFLLHCMPWNVGLWRGG